MASLIVITPGADMALVARNTVADGRRSGAVTSIGILCGVLVHGLASALGLSAIIASSSSAYQIIKAAGAAYLILLGLQTLWRLRRGGAGSTVPAPAWPAKDGTPRPFTEGLLTNVLNPKISVLFLSLMPQFINDRSATTGQIGLLTLTFLALGAAWLTFYVVLIHRLRTAFARPAMRNRIDAVVGTVLVAFGLQLLIRR